MSTPKISVIIPIYNAAPYIEKCAHSLFQQTLDSIEYIFIDDCSPDNSSDILKEVSARYPQRRDQIKLLRNEQNMGVGQTRQRGIDLATGDYIIHCDPDDWIDKELYEKMWTRAIETNSDVIVCGFRYVRNVKSTIRNQVPPTSKAEIFSHFASGKLHGSLCNKLIKRDIAQKFKIEKGINMWEDLSVTPLMLLSANSVDHVGDVYYNYRIDNNSSVSSSYGLKTCKSQINAVESLEKRLKETGMNKIINPDDLHLLNWNALYVLLMSTRIENYREWNVLFNERVKKIPKANLALRFKFLSWLAKHKLYYLISALNHLKRL
ncbi:MAG: glycosyltransferase family 2 protein [Bacteroides sp.]|nr:glycosyltransferase family 2 protein [Bacteroides sp.]